MAIMARGGAEMLAVTVMPGPQMVAAIPLCRAFREKYPKVPIVWGGYFPSLFTDAALNAKYVDFVVRWQGEDTFLELIDAVRAGGGYNRMRGLSYKDQFGLHVHNAERPLRSPGDFPGIRIIAWTRRSTFCRRSWARAPRCTWRASAVRFAATSAAWCRCSIARRWNRPSAPPPSWRICSGSTASTRCSSTTTTSSCAKTTRANWPIA